MDSFNR